MTIGIEIEVNKIQTLTANIKTKHESSCSVQIWSGIQNILDEVNTKSINLKNESISTLISDIGNMVDSNKNFGLPCGIQVAVNVIDTNSVFTNKWNILNKLANGNMLESTLTKLQYVFDETIGNCNEIELFIEEAISLLDIRLDYINSINNKLSQLTNFMEEVLGVLGSVGSLLGCAESMYTSISSASSWLSDINSSYKEGVDAVTYAKNIGGTPADIYNNSINKVNSKLNWDSSISDLKLDMDNLSTNFPI